MNHIYYLGAAYAVVWIAIYLYVRRLTVEHKKLSARIQVLEGDTARRHDP